MKKYIMLIIVLISGIFLTSCKKDNELTDNYKETEFGYIDLKKDDVKIMQLTDVHLSYGFDALDRKTFKLLDKLVASEEPDLIVVTGDVFMSVYARSLLKKFVRKIDSFKIPWAYTFGNHEREYHSMETIVNIMMNMNTKYLHFHYGPKLSNDNTHGYSNYKLKLTNGTKEIMNIYLLDTKANRTDGIKDDDFPYDYLSTEQVDWYSNHLASDNVKSLAFMHIPLVQYLEYDGELNERIWAQGKDTGFFDAILNNKDSSGEVKTLGVFVGHDHENNHEFTHEGVLLAYGVSSGFNAYGPMKSKGAKIITYDFNTNVLKTYNVFEGDV